MITDRTEADVQKAKAYRNYLIAGAEVPSDFNRVMARGTCNSTMLKRINQQLTVIKFWLTRLGYSIDITIPNRDWDDVNEIFDRQSYEQVFTNTHNAKDSFWVYPDTPEIPTYLFGWKEANAIEKVLEDIEKVKNDMVYNYKYCGTIESGESDTL